MRNLPWLFYILAGIFAVRDVLGKVTRKMTFHTLMKSFGNGYRTVAATVVFDVVYKYRFKQSGNETTCIDTVRRKNYRRFRIKGEFSDTDIQDILAEEMRKRVTVNSSLEVSYQVEIMGHTAWFTNHYRKSDESYIPEEIRREMDRIENVFRKIPRTLR